VIVVSYKSATLVAKLLTSLGHEQSGEVRLRVLVVDNASGDAELLRPIVIQSGWQDWVEIVAAPKNGGFAYGNNLGFCHGFESAVIPDYFFLLNPDTEVRAGAVSALVDFLDQHPDAGIAASSLEVKSGELWPFAFRYPSLLSEIDEGLRLGVVTKLLANHVVRRRMGQSPEQVDWFPGAAMMVRAQVVKDIGGMDERYFLYYEETDFCRKATKAGWTSWYVPQSRVMHIAGESTGVTATVSEPRRLPDYWFESRRRYFIKNHGLPYAVATDAASLIAHLLGQVKDTLKGRLDQRVPHFVADFWRHSVLRKANRSVVPAQEFKPSESPR
jgi:hypothetical protein